MRFFEFQNADTVEQELDNLTKLSDQDPDLKKMIDAELKRILDQLNNAAANTPEVTESQEDTVSLTNQLLDRLDDSTLAPADRLRVRGEILNLKQRAEKKARADGYNLGTALSDSKRKQIEKKAKTVAGMVGKTRSWGTQLSEVLSRYEDDQLVNQFLDLVISGKALTKNLITNRPVLKINLKSIVDPSITKIFDNTDAFKGLVFLPFAEQPAGFGGGVGPGESLLAMLIPGAKRASSSDLEIAGQGIWEVKSTGADTNKAWLDSASVSPAELYSIFREQLNSKLRPQFRKKITYANGSTFTLSQVLDLSDFRDEKFKFLRTIFRHIDASTQQLVITKIYEKLFPAVKKKDAKMFSQYVKNTVASILEGNRKQVADLQAKIGLIEYHIGKYNAEGFIVYNYSFHDLIIFRGIEGIISSVDNKENMMRTETITMGNAKKSSAGVTLASKATTRKPKVYD